MVNGNRNLDMSLYPNKQGFPRRLFHYSNFYSNKFCRFRLLPVRRNKLSFVFESELDEHNIINGDFELYSQDNGIDSKRVSSAIKTIVLSDSTISLRSSSATSYLMAFFHRALPVSSNANPSVVPDDAKSPAFSQPDS